MDEIVSESPVVTEEVTPQAQTYKVKVDGQERDVPLDELLKGYSHGSAAAKRMQEAAEIKKSHDELISMLQQAKSPENFMAFAQALGVDFDSLARQSVTRQLEFDALSPEQKKIKEYETENSRMKADLERRAQVERDAQASAAELQTMQQVENDFMSFYQSKGVQPSAEMTFEIASILHSAMSQGENWSVEDAYSLYEKRENRRYEKAIKKAIETGSVPKDLAKQFRQKDVEQFKKRPMPIMTEMQSRPASKKKLTVDQYFERLTKQYNG